MNNIPAVSVVIPLYNKESSIACAIDSVLSQTVSDFELIIVDGHSTDNSQNIVKTYSDSRITLITQDGIGVSSARNQGIVIAKSELIAFLDADDSWMPHFLRTIIDMYNMYPQAGMYGTAFSVYQNNNFVQNILIDISPQSQLLQSYFHSFVKAGHPIIITSAFASRKEVLTSLGGYPEYLHIGEDHELFGKIALNYPVAYSSCISARYNLGSENNADIVNHVLEVPLEKYLSEQKIIPLENNYKLNEYLDHWRFRTGARNIYSGFGKEGRKQINVISSKRYFIFKYIFLLLSILPLNLSKISPTTVRRFLRMFNLST